MDRRQFMLAGAAAMAATAPLVRAQPAGGAQGDAAAEPFKMLYGPHLGLFDNLAGRDPVAQIDFMADQGFRAFEDNGMPGRPVDQQEAIARALQRRGMTMGVFVAYAEFNQPTLVLANDDVRNMILNQIRAGIEVAKRVNAKWMTVVPGAIDRRTPFGYQTANVIDHLKACAELLESENLTIVLEPLNPRDHPGCFLTRIDQAFEICRAVGSPSVKILDDLYHQQITEGDLIRNLDAAWDEIAYIQVGDNPGRNEPTTGEINYRNIFRHLHRKGYQGVIGMEHGLSQHSREGELALIRAYRECDDFEV